jgi:hypothetical protein
LQEWRAEVVIRLFQILINFISQEKDVEATRQEEEKRKKPKPEEHEGMPQRQHYPP